MTIAAAARARENNRRRELFEQAEALAAAGFAVFPVSITPEGKKVPAIKGWPVRATWDDWRPLFSNVIFNAVGIATGKHRDVGGVLAVDVDVKTGKDGRASLVVLDGDLPATRKHQRADSEGFHLLYSVPAPVQSSTSKIAPAIDIKSDAGFVVAYPDNGAAMVPAPAWLVEAAGRPRERAEQAAGVEVPAAFERAARWLEDGAPLAVEGSAGDVTTFKVAAQLKDMGVSVDAATALMLEHWNDRCSPPWDADELAAKVANAYRYGQNAQGSAAPETVFERIVPATPDKPLRFMPAHISRVVLTKRPALIEGIVGRGGLFACAGLPGEGKSFVSAHLAACVASGAPWFGRSVLQGPTIYFDSDGGTGFTKRLHARCQRGADGAPLYVLSNEVINLRSPKDQADLIAAIRAVGEAAGAPVVLTIWDTLNRLAGGMDENSSQDMAQAVSAFDRVRIETGTAVLFVHHLGKDSAKGLRGHSSLSGAVDVELIVSGGKIRHGKPPRDYAPFAPMHFQLETVTIQTSDGAEDTAVVVEGEARSLADFAPEPIDTASNAGKALAILSAMLAAGAVTVAAWRIRFIADLYAGSRKNGSNQFNSARRKLFESKNVRLEGSHVVLCT